MKRIFISSVQKEFERERVAIKKMIESDPILSPNFKVFVFEIDASAADKSTQQVYLKEIEKSDIYLLLVGNKYGYSKEGEVSPTKAGVLLFGRDVQGPFPSSAIKCACYPGTEKRKPNIDMELVEGDLFQMADQAIAFISRHLNHGAGVHSHGAAADDVDEIPNSVIAEAVNNAIAHRNYASIGSIQVEVYSDRVEIISPGHLHRAIRVADLYRNWHFRGKDCPQIVFSKACENNLRIQTPIRIRKSPNGI